MKNIKRKGFTLVELLIVIVVIGILSAMMMLSSTEAVTSARASNIVSNLRNFKTAALAMYVDHLDSMDKGQDPGTTTAGNTSHDILVRYMNKGDSNTGDAELDKYGLILADNAYYVYYNGASDTRVQEKLRGRAKSVGLLKNASQNDIYDSDGKNMVYMFVTKCQL